MERQVTKTQVGEELSKDDANRLGDASGKADDRVLAELLRLAPYTGTVGRVILPHSYEGSGTNATVKPSGAADGSIKINPFRAIIGSQISEGTAADTTTGETGSVKAWRDIRSAIYTGDATHMQGTVQFTANGGGNPRWDLLYAVVATDASGTTENRYVKDKNTLVVAPQSLPTSKVTTVALGVVVGTASATPVVPAQPADAGNNFYIPIAAVRIPSGFTTSSTILTTDIYMLAPIPGGSRNDGRLIATVGDQQYALGGAYMTTTRQGTWGAAGGVRPDAFMPSDQFGGTMLDIEFSSRSGEGFVSGQVVDSRDWRGYTSVAFIQATSSSSDNFPQTAPAAGVPVPGCKQQVQTFAVKMSMCLGQSIMDDGGSKGFLAFFTNANLSVLAATEELGLYVDYTDSGKLKCHIAVTTTHRAFIRLLLAGVYSNF